MLLDKHLEFAKLLPSWTTYKSCTPYNFCSSVLEQASCKDNTVWEWDVEGDWSPETYGRECEVERSSW